MPPSFTPFLPHCSPPHPSHIVVLRNPSFPPCLPPTVPLMPLFSSVVVVKTGRCVAITLIGCDFFIYMTSAQRSWEPTACFLHPSAALVSPGLRSRGFERGATRNGGGRQRRSGMGWFADLLMGLWIWRSHTHESGSLRGDQEVCPNSIRRCVKYRVVVGKRSWSCKLLI